MTKDPLTLHIFHFDWNMALQSPNMPFITWLSMDTWQWSMK